jgi:PAS domain S-box-containing protein
LTGEQVASGQLSGAAVLASAPLAVLVIGPDDRVELVNPAAEALLHVRAEEVVGTHAATVFGIAQDDGTWERIASATGTGEHLEVTVRTGAGGTGTVPVGLSASPLRDPSGEHRGTVVIGRDIAERKALERELAELADSYLVLSRTSGIGMYRFSFDAGGLHVDHVNEAWQDASGISEAELAADPSALWERIPPEAVQRFDHNRRHPAEARWPIEFPFLRPDGTTRIFSITEVPIRDRHGRLRAVHGIAQDISSVRRQEQALAETLELERAAVERLSRIDELRRLFLQAVSHELRTPLTAVVGFAELLRDRGDALEPRTVVALHDRLHRQACKLQALLDDLLDIERLGRGVVQLERQVVDVGDLVAAIVTEQGDPGVEVAIEHAPAAVDAAKIERIVVNLLANARKHVGEDAVVHVEVVARPDRVVLTVSDDGPGIPPGLSEAIFEPFRQGPSAGASSSPGTGIGLTLVAEFARLHGGSASVTTSRLGGAAFVVELPIDPATVLTDEADGPPDGGHARPEGS